MVKLQPASGLTSATQPVNVRGRLRVPLRNDQCYDDDESGGLDYDEFITFMSDMDDMEGGDEDDGEDVIMFMAFGVMELWEQMSMTTIWVGNVRWRFTS